MRYTPLILLALCSYAIADDPNHQHGINVPDWYDASCCNLQDCRPVPDSEIDFSMEMDGPAVVHKPTGIKFDRQKWRNSKDERYHVCYRPHGTGADGKPMFSVYCVYLPSGA